MQIYHPNQSELGLPPTNIFYVNDDGGKPLGRGYLVANCYPELFPERPLQIFINIQAVGPGRDFLFGALLARVQALRAQNPMLRTRVFAQVNQNDPRLAEKLSFYEGNGLKNVDGVDIVQIRRPNASPIPPMGYHIGLCPLDTDKDKAGLLGRMNRYRLNGWSLGQFQKFMSFPHFFSLYLGKDNHIIGEATFTGAGENARLAGLYITQAYRGNGFAKLLLSAGFKRLQDEGVQYMDAELIRSSPAQRGLADCCGASFVRTSCIYPGYNFE